MLKERIFFAQIKDSHVLKPYIDKYKLADDGDIIKTYEWLINSVEHYLERTKEDRNMDKLEKTVLHLGGKGGGKKGKKGNGAPALPAQNLPATKEHQCRFWIIARRC